MLLRDGAVLTIILHQQTVFMPCRWPLPFQNFPSFPSGITWFIGLLPKCEMRDAKELYIQGRFCNNFTIAL